MSLYRPGLYKSGLYKSGLYDHGLVPVDGGGSLFDDLQDLSEPMILATKGSDPEVTGRYPEQGHCLEFDGVDDHVTFDDGIAISSEDVEVEFWMKGSFGTIYSFCSTTASSTGSNLLSAYFHSNVFLYFCFGSGTYTTATRVGYSLSGLSSWNHYRIVRNGNEADATLYFNGVEQVQAYNNMNNGVRTSTYGKLGNVCLSNNNVATHIFNGSLAGLTIKNAGAIVYKTPLNQTTGGTAIDASGNGNQGTLVNSPTWAIDNTMPMEADDWNNRGGNTAAYCQPWFFLNERYELNDDFTIEFDADFSELTGSTFLVCDNRTGGLDALSIYYSTISKVISIYHELSLLKSFAVQDLTDGWHTIKIERISGVITGYYDGISKGNVSNSTVMYVDRFGKSGETVSALFTGAVFNISVNGVSQTLPQNHLIPASTDDPTVDAYGNAIPESFQGSVYPIKPACENSYALRINASEQVQFDTFYMTGEQIIEATIFRPFGTTGDSTHFMGDPIDSNHYLRLKDTVVDGFTASNYLSSPTGITLPTDEWIDVKLILNYSNQTLQLSYKLHNDADWVDGITTYRAIKNTRPWSMFGRSLGYDTYDLSEANISQDGVELLNYTFSEGVGDTVHDTSGNGNHGTIVNGTTGVVGAGTWAGRIDGRSNAHNMTKGFSESQFYTKTGVNAWGSWVRSADLGVGTGDFEMVNHVVDAIGRFFWGVSHLVSPIAHYTDIPHCVGSNVGTFTVFENASVKFNGGTVSLGDRISIKRESGVIKYYHNEVLQYTSTLPVNDSTPLKMDSAVFDSGTLVGAMVLDGTYLTTTTSTGFDEFAQRIPALSDGSGNDALGSPLTNPVNPKLGIAKGSETTLNYYEVTELGDYCPATANLSEFDQVWDDDEKDYLLNDIVGQHATFFRNDSTKEDVVFHDTLDYESFTKADNYTQ